MNGNSTKALGERTKLSPRVVNNWQRRQHTLIEVAEQAEQLGMAIKVLEDSNQMGSMNKLYSLQRQLEHSAALRASALVGDVCRVTKVSPADLTNLVLNFALDPKRVDIDDNRGW